MEIVADHPVVIHFEGIAVFFLPIDIVRRICTVRAARSKNIKKNWKADPVSPGGGPAFTAPARQRLSRLFRQEAIK